nr:hypothetical protein [Nocardia brasiliensis]
MRGAEGLRHRAAIRCGAVVGWRAGLQQHTGFRERFGIDQVQSPRGDSVEQPPTRAERHRKHQQPKLIHRILAQELLRSAHAGEHDDRLVTLVLQLVDLGREIPTDPARGLPGQRDLRVRRQHGFRQPVHQRGRHCVTRSRRILLRARSILCQQLVGRARP